MTSCDLSRVYFENVVEKSGNAWYNKFIRAVSLTYKSEFDGGNLRWDYLIVLRRRKMKN